MCDLDTEVCRLEQMVRKARGLLRLNPATSRFQFEIILGLMMNVIDTARQILSTSESWLAGETLAPLANRMACERDRARIAVELAAYLPHHYLTELAESTVETAEMFFAVWRHLAREQTAPV